MQRLNPASFNAPSSPTLLRRGERVDVALVSSDPRSHALIDGTIAGTDEYGLLIERQNGESVFIPWSSVRTVTKVATGK